MTVFSEKVSDLDTNVLEKAEKVSQSETSVPLSLAEDVNELVVHDSFPDDIIFDATTADGDKIDEQDAASESVTTISVYGSFLYYFEEENIKL